MSLGVKIEPREEAEAVTNKKMETTAIQVNPCHNVICLSSEEGKKLCQKSIQGFPEEQKHKVDIKDIIKLSERIQSKSKEFSWDSITANIGQDNVSLFETPNKMTILDHKTCCDTKWADGVD